MNSSEKSKTPSFEEINTPEKVTIEPPTKNMLLAHRLTLLGYWGLVILIPVCHHIAIMTSALNTITAFTRKQALHGMWANLSYFCSILLPFALWFCFLLAIG